MGRWGGLSSLIDFERGSSANSARFHHHNLSTLTFSTRYNKLDDSLFLLCRNCGHSLTTEELTKMAAFAATPAPANTSATSPTSARFRSSPKQFLTWSASAANHRLQKMSRNIVNNVCKLQNKMEKAFPSSFHLTSSSPAPSDSSSLSDGGFLTLRQSSSNNFTCNNNNNCESSSETKRFRGYGKNFEKNHTNSNNSALLSKSYGTENVDLNSSSFVYHNNSFVRDNNKCDSDLELNNVTSLDSHNLVKSLGIAVDSALDMRPDTQHVFYDSKLSAFSDGGSSQNTTSSSSISTTATIRITSPQWSRASSISMGSSSQCDNQKNVSNFTSPPSGDSTPELSSLHQPTADSSSSSSSPPKNSLCSATLPSSFSSTSSSPQSSSSSSTMSSGSFVVPDTLLNSTMSPTIATSTLPNSKLTVTIFEQEAELKHAPWFQAGIPREIALEVLRNEPIGSFIVRESTTKTGCFALSIRVPREFQPTGIAHYLVLKTGRGYKIKGFTKEFGSLTSLITHHSVMPELLPCPLSLHRYRPSHPVRVSRQHSADFVEPETLITYRKFTDF